MRTCQAAFAIVSLALALLLFLSQTRAEASLVTSPSQGYPVSGSVAEFPPCQGAMRGVAVSLNGFQTYTDLFEGSFAFQDVPDGVYTVHVGGCNPFGCWKDAPVVVAGADATGVRVCMEAHATATLTPMATETPVTPTATPTATPTWPCPMPTPEPLWVDPVTSPTDALTQTVTVYIGNGEGVTVTTESGIFGVTGSFSAWSDPARVEIALLPDVTHHLLVEALVRKTTWNGCPFGGYVLSRRSDRNGGELVIIQQSQTPTPTPPPTASHVPRRVYLPVVVLRFGETPN